MTSAQDADVARLLQRVQVRSARAWRDAKNARDIRRTKRQAFEDKRAHRVLREP